jgi:hypothetical protein
MIYTSRQIGETVNEQDFVKAPPVKAGYIIKNQIQEGLTRFFISIILFILTNVNMVTNATG